MVAHYRILNGLHGTLELVQQVRGELIFGHVCLRFDLLLHLGKLHLQESQKVPHNFEIRLTTTPCMFLVISLNIVMSLSTVNEGFLAFFDFFFVAAGLDALLGESVIAVFVL